MTCNLYEPFSEATKTCHFLSVKIDKKAHSKCKQLVKSTESTCRDDPLMQLECAVFRLLQETSQNLEK